MSAAKSLDLGSVTNSASFSASGSKSGFLTHSSFSDSSSRTTEVGSSVAAGGSLTALAGGDLSVKGVLGAAGDVTLSAGGSFTEAATRSTLEASASHSVSGISLGSGGATGTLGYGARSDASSRSSTSWTPSVIASTGGNVTIASGGAMTIDGSGIAAAGNVTLSGSSVSFTAEQDRLTQTALHKETSIGLSAGLAPDSMAGQAVTAGLGASHSGSGTLAALTGLQAGLSEGISALGGATTNNIAGADVTLGFSSSRSQSSLTQTSVVGSTALAGGTLSVVARGDNASDAANGSLGAVAAQLAGQDVVLAAQKGVNLSAGWDRTQSASSASSHSASVGIEASVGLGGAGLSVTGSLGASHQQATSSSATAVDTTVSAANDVTITTPGALTLNGAEVSGRQVTASAGSLSISSPLNTGDYRSTASSAGLSVSIPVPGLGVGALGGSASAGSQTITDHYASTGSMLSGLYAGAGGLDVTVAGNTTLTAGVLSSGAAANDNHFSTGSLTAGSEANVSQWSGSGVSLSGGAGAAGGKVSGLGTVAVGDVSHEASSLSQSAIGSNITVDAGSSSGSYSRDPGSANGHLANDFNAAGVGSTLQTQMAGQTLAESGVELGVQVANRLGGTEKSGQANGGAASAGAGGTQGNVSGTADGAGTTGVQTDGAGPGTGSQGSGASSGGSGGGLSNVVSIVTNWFNGPTHGASPLTGGGSDSIGRGNTVTTHGVDANGNETVEALAQRPSPLPDALTIPVSPDVKAAAEILDTAASLTVLPEGEGAALGVKVAAPARNKAENAFAAMMEKNEGTKGTATTIPEPTGDFYSVAFEAKLGPTSYPGVSRGAHFQEANEALLQAMEGDANFAQDMQDLGISLQRSPTGRSPRTSPTDWTWHHAEAPGTMQLVPRSQHAPGSIFQDVLHPNGQGGYSIWGK
nr:hemagglutinin repeat-containing protein [Gluconacetobacter asukensis]